MKKLALHRFRVRLFQKLLGLASVLQNIPAKTTPPPFRLMQIGSLFWQSRVLYVATRLGLADVIGDVSKSAQQIANELALNEDYLYRLLRMMGSMGIFEEASPRVFQNNLTSDYLRQDNPKNVRAMILMHNSPEMSRPWFKDLEESLRDGEMPFAKVHGTDLFSYMDQHKDFDLLFSQAMDAVDSLTGSDYLEDFNWAAFERIIDVGGSKGAKSISILKLFPKLRSVVFDRAQIIEVARTSWHGQVADEILDRIEYLSGDMFESLPTAQSDNDLYVFFAIFHGMSDEESKTVLANLKTAMGSFKPHMLIVDTVAEAMNINPTVAAFDMQMLIGTHGRERTLGEWRQLLATSGFEIAEIIDVRTFARFIVARPV